jgi:hypothetical protein
MDSPKKEPSRQKMGLAEALVEWFQAPDELPAGDSGPRVRSDYGG